MTKATIIASSRQLWRVFTLNQLYLFWKVMISTDNTRKQWITYARFRKIKLTRYRWKYECKQLKTSSCVKDVKPVSKGPPTPMIRFGSVLHQYILVLRMRWSLELDE